MLLEDFSENVGREDIATNIKKKNKNIRDLYRGINEFKRLYQII
jgi:hypothetical protein